MNFNLEEYLKRVIMPSNSNEVVALGDLSKLLNGFIKPGDINNEENQNHYTFPGGEIIREEIGKNIDAFLKEPVEISYYSDGRSAGFSYYSLDGQYVVSTRYDGNVGIYYYDLEAVETLKNNQERNEFVTYQALGILPDNQVIIDAKTTKYGDVYTLLNAYAKNPDLIKEIFEIKKL